MSSSEMSTKQQKFAKLKLRVSINLPDNEISLKGSGHMSFVTDENEPGPDLKSGGSKEFESQRGSYRSTKTVVEVLRELDVDILDLQDVKAEEDKDMKPLSDLAAALGMNYVFAESLAPEYGNTVLSKWSIKRSKVQKIFNDSDFRFEFHSPFVQFSSFRCLVN
ncbi:putative Endonuclease/exonuclease/phosphatase superfamily [Helianthus anomalus]